MSIAFTSFIPLTALRGAKHTLCQIVAGNRTVRIKGFSVFRHAAGDFRIELVRQSHVAADHLFETVVVNRSDPDRLQVTCRHRGSGEPSGELVVHAQRLWDACLTEWLPASHQIEIPPGDALGFRVRLRYLDDGVLPTKQWQRRLAEQPPIELHVFGEEGCGSEP